jgi:hypothetical protein
MVPFVDSSPRFQFPNPIDIRYDSLCGESASRKASNNNEYRTDIETHASNGIRARNVLAGEIARM